MTDSELIAALADAIQTLVDVQNGPPLIKRAGEWHEAMVRAQEVLRMVDNRNENAACTCPVLDGIQVTGSSCPLHGLPSCSL